MVLKMSTFLIGLVMIGMIMSILTLGMQESAENYGVNFTDELGFYDNVSTISDFTRDVQNETIGISEKSGVLDVIGGFFSDAFSVLKLSLQSFNIFDSMKDKALDQAELGTAGFILRVGLGTIVLLALVFIVISAIIKREM